MPKMYTVQAVKEVVETEGLAYAVQDYLSPEYIADPILQNNFIAAKQAMDAIEVFLVEKTGEEMDYG